MTGAVLERVRGGAEDGTLRLLDEAEMKALFNDYNDLLNAGVGGGFTMNYEYRPGQPWAMKSISWGPPSFRTSLLPR